MKNNNIIKIFYNLKDFLSFFSNSIDIYILILRIYLHLKNSQFFNSIGKSNYISLSDIRLKFIFSSI